MLPARALFCVSLQLRLLLVRLRLRQGVGIGRRSLLLPWRRRSLLLLGRRSLLLLGRRRRSLLLLGWRSLLGRRRRPLLLLGRRSLLGRRRRPLLVLGRRSMFGRRRRPLLVLGRRSMFGRRRRSMLMFGRRRRGRWRRGPLPRRWWRRRRVKPRVVSRILAGDPSPEGDKHDHQNDGQRLLHSMLLDSRTPAALQPGRQKPATNAVHRCSAAREDNPDTRAPPSGKELAPSHLRTAKPARLPQLSRNILQRLIFASIFKPCQLVLIRVVTVCCGSAPLLATGRTPPRPPPRVEAAAHLLCTQ